VLDGLGVDLGPADFFLGVEDGRSVGEVFLGDGFEVRGEDLVVFVGEQLAVAG